MNRIFGFVIALTAAVLMFTSCEEVGPNIDLGGNSRAADLVDTTYVSSTVEAADAKKVLILDFTGVKCKNCPLGADAITDFKDQNPGEIVSMAMYSEFLCSPYDGDEDLRNEYAQDVQDMLSPFFGKPSAAIDQVQFSGAQGIMEPVVNKWAGFLDQRLGIATPVNIDIATEYDNDTRELMVRVTLHYTATQGGENRLTVALIEDGIIAAQLQPNDDIDYSYEHNHMLREMLTRFNGEVLDSTAVPGRVYIKEFRHTIAESMIPEKMHVVAYVHSFGNGFEVYQAEEAEVVEP